MIDESKTEEEKSEEEVSYEEVGNESENVIDTSEVIEATMAVVSEVMQAEDEANAARLEREESATPLAANADSAHSTQHATSESQDEVEVTATHAELKPVIEALLFVADEPLPFNQLLKILGEVEAADVRAALDELVQEYEQRAGGLEIREIAGGWRISTRPEFHEFIRKYLKSKPTARLSLPALETLAVIAYKQPITVPEILEIRGVSSTSAIKTLLEKRLIVTKGRKETVGRPMMYGTSKEFLLQFGLRDLSELPSIEDFEDLAG